MDWVGREKKEKGEEASEKENVMKEGGRGRGGS